MKKFKYAPAGLLVLLAMILIIVTGCKKIDEPETVTDIDGNVYKTVVIGTQTWMAENLKTTKLSDGTTIPEIKDGTSWRNSAQGAYCYYDNSYGNGSTYGLLYNWYAVSTIKLCPTGWHIPSNDEWTELTSTLGGDQVAGGKMKELGTVHWLTPNTGALNSSGFTGLPGGYRWGYSSLFGDGIFGEIGSYGYWWSSTLGGGSDPTAWILKLGYDFENADRGGSYRNGGASVRCVKD